MLPALGALPCSPHACDLVLHFLPPPPGAWRPLARPPGMSAGWAQLPALCAPSHMAVSLETGWAWLI